MTRFLDRLRQRANALKDELSALSLALRDPRAPLLARIMAALVVAYALSPIDLIPDFIPVLGLLDDLLLLPLGLALTLRLMPPELMDECRARVGQGRPGKKSWLGAVLVIGLWLAAALAAAFFWRRLRG